MPDPTGTVPLEPGLSLIPQRLDRKVEVVHPGQPSPPLDSHHLGATRCARPRRETPPAAGPGRSGPCSWVPLPPGGWSPASRMKGIESGACFLVLSTCL